MFCNLNPCLVFRWFPWVAFLVMDSGDQREGTHLSLWIQMGTLPFERVFQFTFLPAVDEREHKNLMDHLWQLGHGSSQLILSYLWGTTMCEPSVTMCRIMEKALAAWTENFTFSVRNEHMTSSKGFTSCFKNAIPLLLRPSKWKMQCPRWELKNFFSSSSFFFFLSFSDSLCLSK